MRVSELASIAKVGVRRVSAEFQLSFSIFTRRDALGGSVAALRHLHRFQGSESDSRSDNDGFGVC